MVACHAQQHVRSKTGGDNHETSAEQTCLERSMTGLAHTQLNLACTANIISVKEQDMDLSVANAKGLQFMTALHCNSTELRRNITHLKLRWTVCAAQLSLLAAHLVLLLHHHHLVTHPPHDLLAELLQTEARHKGNEHGRRQARRARNTPVIRYDSY